MPDLANDLPFSSERQGRVRAYHGREEPRALPAASRHEPTGMRTRVAFGCCNGWFGSASKTTILEKHSIADLQARAIGDVPKTKGEGISTLPPSLIESPRGFEPLLDAAPAENGIRPYLEVDRP